MPADAMQPTMAVAQFLGQLAVMVPSAVKAVELPPHFPDFRVDVAITIIKPFYAKFRHVGKSTVVVSVAALFNVRIRRALYPNLFKNMRPENRIFVSAKHPSAIFQNGRAAT
jgi:hypothetical protein